MTGALPLPRWASQPAPIAPPGPATIARGWSSPIARIVPYVFAVTTAIQLAGIAGYQRVQIGFDARLYAHAARAWLTGGNPWAVADGGVFFGAPPVSLLPFAPFAFLPDIVTTWGWVVGSGILAALAIRSLGAPAWWLMWWPVVSGCLVGSLDVAAFALLVLARGRLAAFAPIAKIYAVAPILGERRWRAAILGIVLIAASVPWLPWGTWIAESATISQHLADVAATTSVFGQPVLMLLAVAALLLLGLRRASWLAVPALWPSTQPHYLVLSIPAMSPLLAVAWSFPHPYVVLGALVVEAGLTRRRRLPAGMETS